MDNAQLSALLRNLTPYLRPEISRAFDRLSKRLTVDTTKSAGDVAREVAAEVLSLRGGKAALKKSASLISELEALSKVSADIGKSFGEVRAEFEAAALSRAKKKSAAPAKKTSKVQEDLAKDLAAKLEAAKRDRSQFEVLLKELTNAKLVNTPTLHRIAQIFIGRNKKYKNRKPAIDDIKRRHTDELRFAYQDQMLERLR